MVHRHGQRRLGVLHEIQDDRVGPHPGPRRSYLPQDDIGETLLRGEGRHFLLAQLRIAQDRRGDRPCLVADEDLPRLAAPPERRAEALRGVHPHDLIVDSLEGRAGLVEGLVPFDRLAFLEQISNLEVDERQFSELAEQGPQLLLGDRAEELGIERLRGCGGLRLRLPLGGKLEVLGEIEEAPLLVGRELRIPRERRERRGRASEPLLVHEEGVDRARGAHGGDLDDRLLLKSRIRDQPHERVGREPLGGCIEGEHGWIGFLAREDHRELVEADPVERRARARADRGVLIPCEVDEDDEERLARDRQGSPRSRSPGGGGRGPVEDPIDEREPRRLRRELGARCGRGGGDGGAWRRAHRPASEAAAAGGGERKSR